MPMKYGIPGARPSGYTDEPMGKKFSKKQIDEMIKPSATPVKKVSKAVKPQIQEKSTPGGR